MTVAGRAARIMLRVALVAVAVLLMRYEGQHQAAPGVWFAVAVILAVLAVAPYRGRAS